MVRVRSCQGKVEDPAGEGRDHQEAPHLKPRGGEHQCLKMFLKVWIFEKVIIIKKYTFWYCRMLSTLVHNWGGCRVAQPAHYPRLLDMFREYTTLFGTKPVGANKSLRTARSTIWKSRFRPYNPASNVTREWWIKTLKPCIQVRTQKVWRWRSIGRTRSRM